MTGHKEFKVIFGSLEVCTDQVLVRKMYDVMVLPEHLLDIMIQQVPKTWQHVIIGEGKFDGKVIYK